MTHYRMPGRLSDRHRVKVELRRGLLHTVCEEAKCPNIAECFGKNTATFLILGKVCTRSCRFCAVAKGRAGLPVDGDEPRRVAVVVKKLGLSHAVITSVSRDDLEDGGASAFAACILEVRRLCPETEVEVLVPDFQGRRESLELVLDARPLVLNHNVETVPRLYPLVRPQASFQRSLWVLQEAASRVGTIVKSGLMVGLGETDDEVLEVLDRLRQVGCQVVTVGQYLPPTRQCLEVKRRVTEKQFSLYLQLGERLGLRILAGHLVRSSYRAREVLQHLKPPLREDSKENEKTTPASVE